MLRRAKRSMVAVGLAAVLTASSLAVGGGTAAAADQPVGRIVVWQTYLTALDCQWARLQLVAQFPNLDLYCNGATLYQIV
ncbi:hypothetical protein Vqi01_15280 [Micromonospora qiuiae]|uniref:Uncharacterized protein n=1 Tax=Micromonospora qiuiae TaxID=502268 RepID=A0ABQ4J875_9ACTN|nr:hypothetical protein [Micromonospora qiuiae]GIJ26366.1 hypothetical protein Vqi01_15280 [Micromonospora qiuiae]